MNQQTESQQNPTTPQGTSALPRSIRLSTTPGLKPDRLLQAISTPPHFVRSENIDAENGLAFPTAENYKGPAYQVTLIAIPNPNPNPKPESDESKPNNKSDVKPRLISIPNTDSDFNALLMENITIMDFDTPQQEELDAELIDTLLGKGQNWQLVNLICQEGCVTLEFGRSNEDGQLITPPGENDSAVAMIDPDLDNYQIIFQTASDAGIVIDSASENGTTMTKVTKIYNGIIISQSVNTFSSIEQDTPHHWDIQYTS